MSEDLSRRTFLKEATLLAGGLAAGTVGLVGCASGQEPNTPAPAGGVSATEPTAAESSLNYRPAPNSQDYPRPTKSGHIGPNAVPIPPVTAPAQWDEEFDIVVVGSGWGGLTASLIGAQEGKSVALVEKSDVVGGASRHAAGNLIMSGGSKLQEEYGYHWPGDKYDPMAAAAKYQEYSQWTVDDQLLLATIEGGKDWADWITVQPGVPLVCAGAAFRDRAIADHEHNTVLGNNNTCNALEQDALDAGVDIKVLTECVALVQEGDRVVGIKISDVNGDESFLRAKMGVLLTAGGFGVNLDLLEQYAPTAYMYATQGGPMASHTGDCFRMGIGVGADVAGFNSFSCWEGGLDEYWGNGDGNYYHYFWHGENQVIQNPWLKIDKAGNRLEFFALMAVDGVKQERVTFESRSVGDLTNGARWSSAIGHRAYNIFDSNFKDSLEIFKLSVGGSNDPHRYPLSEETYWGKTTASNLFSFDWESEFQAAVDRGAISKADTIEELAKMLGLNVEKTVAAVDHWNNDICPSGIDTDLPVPYKPEWLIPVNNPPYYGAALGGQISKTMTGLRVNPKMQVTNDAGDPIPGLYAGFFTAGGICGENNYGGQFGNPTIHGGVAISGVGGYMAIHGILENE